MATWSTEAIVIVSVCGVLVVLIVVILIVCCVAANMSKNVEPLEEPGFLPATTSAKNTRFKKHYTHDEFSWQAKFDVVSRMGQRMPSTRLKHLKRPATNSKDSPRIPVQNSTMKIIDEDEDKFRKQFLDKQRRAKLKINIVGHLASRKDYLTASKPPASARQVNIDVPNQPEHKQMSQHVRPSSLWSNKKVGVSEGERGVTSAKKVRTSATVRTVSSAPKERPISKTKVKIVRPQSMPTNRKTQGTDFSLPGTPSVSTKDRDKSRQTIRPKSLLSNSSTNSAEGKR